MSEHHIQLEWIRPTNVLRSARFRLPLGAEIHGWKIHPDFKTDGATLPRVVRIFMSPFGALLPAAIVHDFLLKELPGQRRVAAHEFRRILKECGVNPVARQLCYWAVRLNDHIVKFRSR